MTISLREGAGSLLAAPAILPNEHDKLHVHDGSRFASISRPEWAEAAERKAAALRDAGVVRGTRVACVLTNSLDVCTTLFGIWGAGGIVMSLPTLGRGMDPFTYADQLRRLYERSQAELLLIEEQYLGYLQEYAAQAKWSSVVVRSFESLASAHRLAPEPPGDDDVAFVQFSSGSTSDPKGCALTSRAISNQIDLLVDAIEPDPRRDFGVSWLPLSHDMGLFGCLLLCWAVGGSLALSTPQRFMASPRTWLSDCCDFSGTLTAGPSFALDLVARTARVGPALSRLSLRHWLVGGEHIAWSTMQRVASTLAPFGVPLRAFAPAYGLAEATVGVTMVRPDEVPHALFVNPEALALALRDPLKPSASGELLTASVIDDSLGAMPEGKTPLVSAGRPLAGVSIEPEPPGQLGEVVIRSPSLAQGYLGDDDATRKTFSSSGARSGDLGFVGQLGELYVVGRTDDMIPVRGRNIFAREFEDQLRVVEGTRAGTCVLVDVPDSAGHRSLVVIAEPATGVQDYRSVARDLRDCANRMLGMRVDRCVITQRGSIPKTPSGKVQRHRCRALIETEGVPFAAELT